MQDSFPEWLVMRRDGDWKYFLRNGRLRKERFSPVAREAEPGNEYYGSSNESVPDSPQTHRAALYFPDEGFFRVSHAREKCWDIPSVFHFSILFPKDTRPFFWGFSGPRPIRKSGNAVFLEEYVAFGIDFLPIGISDARPIRTPGVAASRRCDTAFG
jgi:hypothetical protein